MSSGSVKRYVTSWPHRGWNFLSLLSQGLSHTWFLKQFSVFLITGNLVGNCPWGLCAMKCGLINLLAQSRLSRASSDNSVLYWVSHWLLLIRRISLSLIFVLHELLAQAETLFFGNTGCLRKCKRLSCALFACLRHITCLCFCVWPGRQGSWGASHPLLNTSKSKFFALPLTSLFFLNARNF